MKFFLAYILLLSTMAQPRQGIEGFLSEARGNQMGIQNHASNKGQPLKTKLYLFKKLGIEDLIGLDGQWCKSVQQKPVKIIETDNKGYFKCHLSAGNYVVLVGAYDGYFIPSFNHYNQPSNIVISPRQWQRVDILVNSKAIY